MFLYWLHFYVRNPVFLVLQIEDISQPAAAASLLFHFQSLAHWFVCTFVFIFSSHCLGLIWHQCTVLYCLFFLSNSGVRQKVCSALVLLKNNSIRHGQGLRLCLSAASFSAMLCCCLMKWFSGSRDVWFISTPLNHSTRAFENWKCIYNYYNKHLFV